MKLPVLSELKTGIKIVSALSIIAVLVGLVGIAGYSHYKAKEAAAYAADRDKEITLLNADIAVLGQQLEAEQNNIKIVTEYVDRVQVVKVKGDTIIKRVPVYVTKEDDARCTVPTGFVRVHDAAAANQELPAESSGAANADPSGVALSAVAGTVAGNYTAFYEVREQLIALQKWVKENTRGQEAHDAAD